MSGLENFRNRLAGFCLFNNSTIQGKQATIWGIVIAQGILLNAMVANTYAQVQEQETAAQTVQRVCSQCHALEIQGNCLAGDCAGKVKPTIRRTSPPPWEMVLDWMGSKGARFTDGERQEILAYLQENYPSQSYPLAWKRINAFVGQGGWNVTSLQGYGEALYAGFEGNGKIFRTTDGTNWQEALNTHQSTVYGITSFRGALYAATDEPYAQIWRSVNGLNWQLRASLPTGNSGIQSMGVFKNKLYAGTARSWIYRSSDGLHWEQVAALKGDVPNQFSNWTRFLIPFKGYLYAGTELGSLYRSVDGLAWTQINGEVSNSQGFRGATVFKNALYVGATRGGVIWKTEDGKVWQRAFKAPHDFTGYVASMAVAGKYLFAGINGYVFRTIDGSTWEEVGHLGPSALEAMTVWRGTLYVGAIMAPDSHIYSVQP
ncbi:MAG: hypothetical protein Q7S51_10710 [Gallionellaceae bacterium]|nr:hypothetical protein [Gallionellaceae bacterium]